ncbi:MAG: MFS transporter [Chloroflexota bacterium]|nr:MFS transporter [Chloroflexota bacterium]
MKKRQLIALFICNLIVLYIGGSLLPLLPIYATELGAEPAVTGNYLSFVYLSLAVGTASAGWLASRVGRRSTLIVLMSLIMAPLLWLMGHVTQMWQLALLTSMVWFAGGVVLTLGAILASLSAAPQARGKVFGVLGLTGALGGLLGGITAGPIVDHWSWPALFAVMALLQLVQLGAGLALQDPVVTRRVAGEHLAAERQAGLGRTFLLLLAANLLSGVTIFIGMMGRSLLMDAQGFTATTITWTGAVGAVVGLLLNPLLGHLSDRFNRHLLLALTYAGNMLSMVAMVLAASVLDWSLVALLAAVANVDRVIASALAVDLLPPEMIDHGMSRFEAVKWAGGIFGFAGTGYAIQLVGLRAPMVGGAILSLLAILLLALAGRAHADRSLPSQLPLPMAVQQSEG